MSNKTRTVKKMVVSNPPFAGFQPVVPCPPLRATEWTRPLADGSELRFIDNVGLFWVRGDSWWPMAFVRSEEELGRFIEIMGNHE